MNALQTFFSDSAIHAWGWTLVQFVWQAGLVALLLKILLAMTRGQSANLQYCMSAAALAVILIIPFISFSRAHFAPIYVPATHSPERVALESAAQHVLEPAGAPSAVLRFDWRRAARESIYSASPWIAALWLVAAISLVFRTLAGLIRLRSVKKLASPLTGEEWERRLGFLARGSGITGTVRLLVSHRVGVPSVVGWLKPVILLPSDATSLAPQLVDALIAHELAHIRRRDYPVNVLQTVVEDLLFYHPCVRWVSSQVRMEREFCCDDSAAALCGDALTYARAPSCAERLRFAGTAALAATGAPLLTRIQRVTEKQIHRQCRTAASLIGFASISALLAGGAASSLLISAPENYRRPLPPSR